MDRNKYSPEQSASLLRRNKYGPEFYASCRWALLQNYTNLIAAMSYTKCHNEKFFHFSVIIMETCIYF